MTGFYRGRRLRKNAAIRSMMKETRLQPEDFVLPIFVVEGEGIQREISSLPGHYHYSVDKLENIVEQMQQAGVPSCILFGIPDKKDSCGSEASNEDGVVQRAIRRLRQLWLELYIIADVCMCEYTSHGHCGILNGKGEVLNDETLPHLAQIAITYAEAGVDMVAPSDMMDGHIAAIRSALDESGFEQVAIMGYSAKYASAYYGPFREAAGSAPAFGDRKSYQMDCANGKEAMREMQADVEEGADLLMVKPALAYLDVLKEATQTFRLPVAAYNVSGEYAMLKMAVQQGLMAESVIPETLTAIKRAGAKLIITYFALEAAQKLKQGEWQ